MAQKEATARIKINRLLESAGWRFFDDGDGPANIVLEPNVKLTLDRLNELGDDLEKAAQCFVDFLLLDDLVQDCVLRALENWRKFGAGTHMRRWLFTILRNRHLDICRQNGRRGPAIALEDCKSAHLVQQGSQEDWIELRECVRKLGKARGSDQTILLLSVFSDLSQKEIAARLGVAEGTIRSRLSRIRATLRA